MDPYPVLPPQIKVCVIKPYQIIPERTKLMMPITIFLGGGGQRGGWRGGQGGGGDQIDEVITH